MASKFIESLPPDYANYVKVLLDPFHDKSFRFDGAPTSRSATSVVLCLNQETTVAADDFYNITDETWDCHISMFPMISAVKAHWAREYNNVLQINNDNEPSTVYPLTAHGVNSGEPTFSTPNYVNALVTKGLDTSTLMAYETGSLYNGPGRRTLRIVGAAFEVVNETPDIYQQGAVTVYRYPLSDELVLRPVMVAPYAGELPNAYNLNDPTPAPANQSFVEWRNICETRMPPTNQATAVLVPGSQTWKARDGCYCIATQYVDEVPFKTVASSNTCFTGYTPTLGAKYDTAISSYSLADESLRSWTGALNIGDAPTAIKPALNATFPFNLSGAYFTGLSKQYAVLRIRYKVFVEILTDPSDNLLAPLGNPTIPYDSGLQQLVMRTLAKLPPGFPQTWNPEGEVWRTVLNIVGSILAAAAPALGAIHPTLQPLSGIAGTAMVAMSNVPDSKKKRKGNMTPQVAKAGPNGARAQRVLYLEENPSNQVQPSRAVLSVVPRTRRARAIPDITVPKARRYKA